MTNIMSETTKFMATALLFAFLGQSCLMLRTSHKKTVKFFERANTKFLDTSFIDGKNKIHYLQTGNRNNATIVFIHGSPGSWNTFKQYLVDSTLLSQFNMVSVDRPGFGYSKFGEAKNLETQSKYLKEFIKSIQNNKPIILVGHSLGGPVITKLAVENPALFSNLVILAGALDPAAEKSEKWRTILKKPPFRYLLPGALRPSNDELWWLKKDLQSLKLQLPNLIANVTIIHGTKDRLVPFSNVTYMKAEFTNAKTLQIIAIEKANHFIPWYHYDRIRNTLLTLKIN